MKPIETERFRTNSHSNPHQEHIPEHVAVIMDGNGRWAESQGKPRFQGHRAGKENIRVVIEAFADHGVSCLTIFAFSTENWGRPDHEVQGLISILSEVIRSEVKDLHALGIKIKHIGRLDRLTLELQESISESIKLTRNNTGMILNVAFDYGGRDEILEAVRRIIADHHTPEEITEDLFREYLDTGNLPDPDLIIRTAGEMRISNFLLWQSAYAEYYTTPILWPNFDEVEVAKALDAYASRLRRFGRIMEPAS